MFTQTSALLLALTFLVGNADASPVVVVNSDGSLNTTYVPYAVLAALGYGAATLAGVHAYQLWSPIIENDNLRTSPDPAIAYKNRAVMSDWLKRNIADPGSSPTLDSLRNTLGSKRRTDTTDLYEEKNTVPVAAPVRQPLKAGPANPPRRPIRKEIPQRLPQKHFKKPVRQPTRRFPLRRQQ